MWNKFLRLASKNKQIKKLKKLIFLVPKRIRIVLSTLVMVFLSVFSTFFVFIDSWWYFIPIIILISGATTYFAIFEGVDGVEWYMLFIVPIFFALALYFSYSLFPARWLTRLPFIILFSLGYYAVLLTMNIFNVGVTKSIQLYRAAFSINYIAQTFIIFLTALAVLSFRFPYVVNGMIIGLTSFMLSLQLFWSVNLEKKINKNLILYSLVLAIISSQLTILITFVPLTFNISALILTGYYYSVTGILYHALSERLFKNIVREYIFVMIFIFIITIFTLRY
jgi:hypothetical protein